MSSMVDLIAAMEQGPSTSGWDVVCSYSVSQLNAALAQNYAATGGNIIKDVQFSTQRIDVDGTVYVMDFDISFHAPAIAFVPGKNGMCQLTMKMKNASCATYVLNTPPSAPKSLPDDTYSVVVLLPVVSATGSTDSTPSGTIFNFGADDQQAHITLSFKTSDETAWNVSPAPADSDPAWTKYFLKTLSIYCQNHVDEIAYTLASIRNGNDATPPMIAIRPQSFVFATYSDADSSVLSLYIQTANMPNGQPGQAVPSFQPGGTPRSPIPDGAQWQASLIFRREFLQQVFLTPSLAAQNFSVTLPQNEALAGMAIIGTRNANFTITGSNFSGGMDNVDIDDSVVDLSSAPYTFQFSASSLGITFSTGESTNWSVSTTGPRGLVFTSNYTANSTIALNKSMQLSAIASMANDAINIDCNVVASDYVITVDPGKSDSCWNGNSDGVTGTIQGNLANTVPPFGINLDGLRYFQMTNLLFPNEAVLQMDTGQGIQIPRDLIMVASFATPPTARQ